MSPAVRQERTPAHGGHQATGITDTLPADHGPSGREAANDSTGNSAIWPITAGLRPRRWSRSVVGREAITSTGVDRRVDRPTHGHECDGGRNGVGVWYSCR